MSNNKYEGVVGIDLGTTNSVVTRIDENGEFVNVPNKEGELLTPSFIWVDADEETKNIDFNIGKIAREKMSTDPKNVLSSYKTHMGTNEPIKELLGMPFTAQHCSVLALQYMKEGLQENLQQANIRAVITVPAYFQENQKSATHTSAVMSGMDVLGIITEPTASALFYTKEHDLPPEGKMVLVYDLGGGTFDTSIIHVTKDNATEQAIDGDHFLGGDDFDSVLRHHVEVETKLYRKLTEEQKQILTRRCEEAKRNLMNDRIAGNPNPSVTIDVSDLGGNPTKLTITLQEFNEITKSLVDRTLEKVDSVLEKAMLPMEMIDEVILVGGSSRLDGVIKALAHKFEGKFDEDYFRDNLIDPDLAISGGAAIYAKLMIDGKAGSVSNTVPMPLGVRDVNGNMSIVINAGAPIPARGSRTFTTNRDNQDFIVLKIFEGTSNIADNNQLIGEMSVPVPPNSKQGKFTPLLNFRLNTDGILQVQSIGDTVQKLKIDRKAENIQTEIDKLNTLRSNPNQNNKQNIDTDAPQVPDMSDLSWEG